MNITILSNSMAWGGLEMNTFRLAQWLKAAGHSVSMICPENSRLSENLADSKVKALVLAPRLLKRGNPLSAYKVYRYLQKEATEFLIVGHSRDINLAVFIKLFSRKKIKVVYLQQMRIGVSKRDFLHNIFYQQLDAWIAPLPYLKENVLEYTKISAKKIHVIPLCIEIEAFVNKTTQTIARRHFELPEKTPLVGIIGRLDPSKGQIYLIEALAEVRQKGHNLQLLIMGEETKGQEDTYLPLLKERVKRLSLESYVHFRDFTQDTPLAYASLDIFVTASLFETYGMVTIEAMASRLPVVGVNTFGTKDLIEPELTGLYCQPEDAKSLAQALVRLLEQADFAQSLAQKAQERVKERYSHKVQVAKTESLLAKL